MKRRTDLAPLPRRVAPRPWEDIASSLSRTASAMGYSDPRWLLHPQEVSGFSITESDLPYLSRKDDYLVLERLLQLNEEALYQMTVHRFASVLHLTEHGPEENPSCIDRPLLDRPPRVSRSPYMHLCPLCLSEPDGYDRVYWRIPSIMSCPEHHVILLMHCPQCHRPIRALRRDAHRCPSCHTGDYRRLAVSFLSDKHPLFLEELLLVKALGIPSTAAPDVPEELTLLPLLLLKPADYWYLFTQTATLLRHFGHELLLEFGAILDYFGRTRRGVVEQEIEQRQQQELREACRLMGTFYDEQLKSTLDKMRTRASPRSTATSESV